MSHQIVMVCLEYLVPTNHMYRKFLGLWNFNNAAKELKKIEKDNNYTGYGALMSLVM